MSESIFWFIWSLQPCTVSKYKGKPCKCVISTESFVGVAVGSAQNITIAIIKTFKDDKGKYGRILGEIWYGGEHNINQLLIDNHHAVKYHGQSKEEIAEEHLANRQKLGLETVQSFEE